MNSCVGIIPYVVGSASYGVDGLAQVDGEEYADASAQQFSGGLIKILSGADMPGNIGYLLNGTEFDMQPGYSQKFAEDRVWVIQFRAGDENSEVVEYTLTAGEYQFVVVDGKLNLMPVSQEGLAPSTSDAPQNATPQEVAPQAPPTVIPDATQYIPPETVPNVIPEVTEQPFSPDSVPNAPPVAP